MIVLSLNTTYHWVKILLWFKFVDEINLQNMIPDKSFCAQVLEIIANGLIFLKACLFHWIVLNY